MSSKEKQMVFSPGRIGRLELKNRLVRSATYENKDQEAYFLSGAQAVKRRTGLPIILVGGIRTLDRVEEILQSGAADFISLSRPLIRQPDLPDQWLSGEHSGKADCISCNACIGAGNTLLKCRQVNP